MTDNILTIKDPTVYVKPCNKAVQFLKENFKGFNKKGKKVPENIRNIIENNGNFLQDVDIAWLNDYLKTQRNEEDELLSGKELDIAIEKIMQNNYSYLVKDFFEEKSKNLIYLHDLMEGSVLILPENEVVERNPILKDRVEKLKKEQEELEYKKMTKNVDMSKKFITEDSLSYQMNMMNRHLIAVAQFLISVGAGFAFGFLGIELIVGDLNFGVRLLLGISCALVIALAEFYFLAKHLNQEDKETEKEKSTMPRMKTKTKPHKD